MPHPAPSMISATRNLRLAHLVALLVPAVLLTGALLFQYVGGLTPCEMCMMQRWPHVAALVLGTAALAIRSERIVRVLVMSAAGAVATSGLVAVDHLGVERRWWEGHTACTSSLPTGMSTADYLDALMRMPLVRCDTPQWTMLGLSLADMNALVSIGTAIAVAWLVMRSRARSEVRAADAA